MDNRFKKILRRSRAAIWLYQTWKRIIVLPLYLTPLGAFDLRKLPLKDIFNRKKTALLEIIVPYTKAGYPRMTNIYETSIDIEERKIVGAFVECGTWKGGLAAVMGAIAARYGSGRKTWYLDSFEGMPAPAPQDGTETAEIEGDVLKASVSDVEELIFGKLHLSREDNIIVKGWFEKVLPEMKKEIGPIAILRLDADWYEATKCCLEELYDLVVTGGYVIFDDYSRWEGCKKAADEFFVKKGVKPAFQYVGNYGNRVVYFKK